jgi:hypothetical protein
MLIQGAKSVKVSGATFDGNLAQNGAALFINNNHESQVDISDTTFIRQRAHNPEYYGGSAVVVAGGKLSLRNSRFNLNVVSAYATAGGGGAINTRCGVAVTIADCAFDSNSVVALLHDPTGSIAPGGAIYSTIYSTCEPNSLSIARTNFTGNTGFDGGAVYFKGDNVDKFTCDQCLCSDNATNDFGGDPGGATCNHM